MLKTTRFFKNNSKIISSYLQVNSFSSNLKLANHPNCVSAPNLKIADTNSNISSIIKRFIQNKQIKCWKCGIERKNITDLFCEQCNHIQNPENKENYFKIFELEEKFTVDLKLLTEKYRKLQSVLHPDKFSNKIKEEKLISEEFSSLINRAYKILLTPLDRAIHLLKLKGEIIDETHKIENPEFLMEIMKLNEEVENADTPEKLRALNNKNRAALDEISLDITANFEQNDVIKAKENIVKMKYYNSVGSYINNLMREKGIVD